MVLQTWIGKGNALACGFAAATGDIIVMIDADGSTDPAEIPRFIAALTSGADFVKGSRFTRADGAGSSDITMLRRLGNRALGLVGGAPQLWRNGAFAVTKLAALAGLTAL